MAQFHSRDLATKGTVSGQAIVLASRGYIPSLVVEGVIIRDGVKWSEAYCLWNDNDMIWSFARTYLCRRVEEVIRRPAGGSFVIYVPADEERKKKQRKYIKLTCTVLNDKKVETKEVKDDIKVTSHDIDFIIKESLVKLQLLED